jgi:hypothetical protein
MSKETFYFQHDYHARKDPKCQALISLYGVGAYGTYWSLIEIMHEQGGKIKKFPALLDGLSFELRTEKELLSKQIEAMLHELQLLVEDDNYIWSERVLDNIKIIEAKRMLRVEAGKLGGIKSGISRLERSIERSKTKQGLKQNEANEPKKRKENKIKEILFLSDSDEIRLSEFLFSLIAARDPQFKKPNFQKWAEHIDRLIRIDKRSAQDIEDVITWCQNDSFWQNNILSTNKLRDKFTQLTLKMNGKGGQPKDNLDAYVMR